ncbi:hypothetical protein P5689_06845 [Asaia sp. HumB]|nr:hypothetical protein [Asaia sp. HumB]MDL2170887.1 hypothetical protein [Asaia sp. HumB]
MFRAIAMDQVTAGQAADHAAELPPVDLQGVLQCGGGYGRALYVFQTRNLENQTRFGEGDVRPCKMRIQRTDMLDKKAVETPDGLDCVIHDVCLKRNNLNLACAPSDFPIHTASGRMRFQGPDLP